MISDIIEPKHYGVNLFTQACEVLKNKTYWKQNDQIELWAGPPSGKRPGRRGLLLREGGFIRIHLQSGYSIIEPGFAIGMIIGDLEGQKFERMLMVTEASYRQWAPKARAAIKKQESRRVAQPASNGAALWVTVPT